MGASSSSSSSSSSGILGVRGKDIGLDCCMIRGKEGDSGNRSPKNSRRQLDGFMKMEQGSGRRPSSTNSRRGSNSVEQMNETRASSDRKNSPERRNSSPPRNVGSAPSWSQDPIPLADWTRKDQRILMSELEQHPYARKHPEHLKQLFARIHRILPHKSLEDIEMCFRHIETKKIAVFSSGEKDPRTLRRKSSYPSV
jgi:hypothetical protein